uniref:Uncharacterized protein n=1 Tax=Anguilla anguilla TaxID=7936 RepID=A0A0E9VNB0_ANGAN
MSMVYTITGSSIPMKKLWKASFSASTYQSPVFNR